MNHWIENIGREERRKREPPTDIFMNIGGPFLLTEVVPRGNTFAKDRNHPDHSLLAITLLKAHDGSYTSSFLFPLHMRVTKQAAVSEVWEILLRKEIRRVMAM